MKVKIKLDNPADAALLTPKKGTPGAAGFDLVAAVGLVVLPGTLGKVNCGFSIEIEEGYEVQVRPRSGHAFKNRITIINSPGTIDSDYRGPVIVGLINHGTEPFVVHRGDRIAQMVVCKLPAASIEVVEKLSETARGEGGFGSTGTGTLTRDAVPTSGVHVDLCMACNKPLSDHAIISDTMFGNGKRHLECPTKNEFPKSKRND